MGHIVFHYKYEHFLLLDSGSGIRDFGNSIMQSKKFPCTFHIFMSHVHWDHIQGFPFFIPGFIKGNKVKIYGFHDNIEKVFIDQQTPPFFPVPLEYMQAEKQFIQLSLEKEYEIAGFKVRGISQNHPGGSYGYSFEKNNKKIIYSTDSEHDLDRYDLIQPFIEFFKDSVTSISCPDHNESFSLFIKLREITTLILFSLVFPL